MIKGLFNLTSFDDGFFWSRAGFVIFALTLLLIPGYGKKIFAQAKSTGKRASALVLGNKVIAGLASVLILKATDLASVSEVSIVQALGGLQYIFVFIIAVAIAPYAGSACGEGGCGPKVLLHKAIFISIITLGFFVLFR